jgi:peptidoglycan-N-acetylglucosamine deacetylase
MVRLSPAAAARGEVALSFDDGPDPAVTPKVLQVLDQYGVKASFFCIGKRAIACPGIVAETAARGHRVENHSFSHSHAFGFYGVKSLASDIHRSQEALEKITGCRPSLLRAPAGIRNLWLDPVLTQLDLTLVSWTRRGFDTVCRQPQTITQRLIQGLAAGDILLLHDGSSCRDVHGRPVVLEVLPRLIEAIAAKGLAPVPIAPLRTATEWGQPCPHPRCSPYSLMNRGDVRAIATYPTPSGRRRVFQCKRWGEQFAETSGTVFFRSAHGGRDCPPCAQGAAVQS